MGISVPGWQVRAWTAPAQPAATSVDVVVVGGGLSGCAAAIAAARRGARVLLLEPTHLLGGQMSVGGVGTVDQLIGFRTTVEQGLWGEIARRVRQIYAGLGLTAAVANYRIVDSLAANAPIVDRVLTELCSGAGVDVVRNCTVSGATVTRSSATLQASIGTVIASVAVDATEDGSLIPMAGLPYRIANLTGVGDQIDGDPTEAAVQRMTQCAVIRRYDSGVPDNLKMVVPPVNYEQYRDNRPNGQWIAGSYPGKPYGTTTSDNDFAGYRAYPDIADLIYYDGLHTKDIRRTSLNHANDVVINADFLSDPTARRNAITEGLRRTLSVIYYLQNECNLPWAIAQDEGFREGPAPRMEGVTPEMPDWVVDMPVLPYVRESRRLRGAYTLTGKRIKRPRPQVPSAWSSQNLAVGTYPIDMHGSKGVNDFETDLGESAADLSTNAGPFIIPFGAFVPADDSRLVAAEKNLSMSRLASGAIRVHPSVTAAGEAAGVIAALAWRTGVAPRAVSYRAVQVSLLRGRALLTPYPIRSVPVGHPDFPAVSLAVLNNRIPFKVDNISNQVEMSNTSLAAAKKIGRGLVTAWKGPV